MGSKKLIVLTFLVIVLSGLCLAYDLEYSSYGVREIEEKLQEWTPEGWDTGFLQAGYLEGLDSIEYIIWHIFKTNNTSKSRENQLFVFKYLDERLELVWKSDAFGGRVLDLDLQDMNNDGQKNINTVLVKEENDDHVRYLRSYNWQRDLTYLVYPSENLSNIYADHIELVDADNDGDIEITAYNCVQEEPRKYRVLTYCYQNGSINLEKEKTEPDSAPSLTNADVQSIDDKDKSFDEFLKSNSLGFLLQASYLYREGLYLLEAGTSDGEDYNRYIVVKQEHGTIKLLYKIDKVFNDTIFDYLSMQDINLDGYVEIMLMDTTTIVKGSLVYIISLLPHGTQIISPVTERQLENGRFMSDMYLDYLRGPLNLIDINNDSVPELGTTTYYNDDFATQYWIWDKKYRVYAPYKLEIWDENTNSFIFIDQPADI